MLNEELINALEAAVKDGYVRKQRHPTLPLAIYNYTDKCTFDRAWTTYTLQARGLIVENETGRIVARPFPKFFNLGECEETFLGNLPNLAYSVFEKVDGSLGIIFQYNNEWHVATRGSFTSDQAIEGRKILEQYNLNEMDGAFTYLAEIIYPENRIISDYGKERKLVLLGAYTVETGTEISRDWVSLWAHEINMPISKAYNHTIEQCIELKKTLPKLEEGFVVRFANGLRVKIKGDEYCKIAKIISCLSPLSLWEVMKEGKVDVQYLQQIPEEFRPTWEPMVKQLEEDFAGLVAGAHSAVTVLAKEVDITDFKAVGIFLKENKGFVPYSEHIWPILRNRPEQLEKAIMNVIRPTGNVLEVKNA